MPVGRPPSRSVSLRRMAWSEAVLLANGDLVRPEFVRRLCASGAGLLCADGGARHAARLGLEPRLVIGDMDSLPRRLPPWKKTVFLCDFDQDRSDLEKALRFLVQRGVRKVWVAGALGGGLDHQLVNLALLETYSAAADITLVGEPCASIVGKGNHDFRFARGSHVTFLPATPAARVSASGLKYPMRGIELTRTSRGLSNEAAADTVRVAVEDGRLWVAADPRR